MSPAVESWEDDESFALPSNDFNPIRISSASSYSSAGVLGGDEDDDEDWGVEDFGGRVGAGSFKLGVPSGSGGGGGIGGWGTRSSDAQRDGFDEMDDEDEDDRTDTLKAGQTTIRLPPPSSFQHSSSSSSNTPTLSTPKMTGTVRRLANQSSISSFVIPPDVDIEDGFSLPTSLSNLNLRPLRSQSSRASFSSITTTTSASNSITTANSTPGSSYTWGDTPSSSSSTNSGGAATGGGSFSRKSNGTTSHPRLSAPSPSSSRVGNILHIPFSPPSLVRSSSEAGDHPSESSSLDFAADASEDADDLDGIVLSDPLFFSRTNDVRLQALLDAKGKGHTVPVPSPHHSSSNANSSRSGKKGGADNVRIVSAGGATDEDMSFEAGLVIDDDVPITMGRLGRVRSKARNKTLPLPKRDVGVKGRAVGGSGLGAGGTVPSGRVSTKEDWEKDLERERGWGRTKSPNPSPVSVRETFRQPDDHHPSPSPSSSSRPTASTSTRPRPPQSRSATAGSLSVANTLNSSPPGSSLRVAKSHARINLGHGTASSSSLHPSSAAPPSPSPHQQPHYPGSHAASLLSRKSSLPMLFANEQERSSTPSSVAGSSSGGGAAASGRFAAPTAASLARQRDRIGGPDLFNPPSNSSTTSPPTSSRPSTPSSPFPLSPSMATVQPFHQRLTMPTSSSRQKTRPAITPHLFSTGSHPTVTTTAPTPNRRAGTLPKPELVSMPKKKRQYGDGTELDGFEDLKVDREKEGRYRVGNATGSTPTRRETKPLPSSSTSPPPANPPSRQGFLRTKLTQVTSSLTAPTASTDLKRKKPTTGEKSSTSTTKSGPPRAIKLIRYMGDPSSKVVRQMRYNPKTLRWEGNESALQAFEGLSSSARPLLIAHHTGKSTTSLSSFTTTTVNDLHSSITTSNLTPSNSNQSNLNGNGHHPGSPISASAAISLTAKVVGNMWFDPERMKWIHMGGLADEEEEDVFAGMDDEDEVELALKGSSGGASGSGSIAEREEKRSSSRARRIRESGASSNSGTTAMDLDDFLASEGEEDGEEGVGGVERKTKEKEFARRCRLAEEGHRAEVAGWGLGVKVTREREETRLWEIRRVAMRTGREREGSSRN